MFASIVGWLVDTIGALGYPGIVGLMFLESSFFPFPSEVVMPPAGYLAYTGEMNLYAVIFCGILGSLLGALFNYWIAYRYGRSFFERFGKYFFVSPEVLDKAEVYFAKHGHISTFIGRLLVGIRQYISLPAGVARMNLASFCVYTVLGAGIWVTILTLTGYWLGKNQELIHRYITQISVGLVVFCVVLALVYVVIYMRKRKKSA